jgi:hypothetical protein
MSRRIRDTGPSLPRVRDTGGHLPQLEAALVAQALGAELVETTVDVRQGSVRLAVRGPFGAARPTGLRPLPTWTGPGGRASL